MSEFRKKSELRIPNNQRDAAAWFHYADFHISGSDFGFLSDLGFRFSGFTPSLP